jgi:hypothetical protein
MAHRLIQAADTLEELNARTDSGERAAWTVNDLRHMAGSVAAEDHTDGICPACLTRVLANEFGNICLHADTVGKTCTASGLSFHLAVAS